MNGEIIVHLNSFSKLKTPLYRITESTTKKREKWKRKGTL